MRKTKFPSFFAKFATKFALVASFTGCLDANVYGQTAGSSSATPIELTFDANGYSVLSNQQPSGNNLWYKVTPNNSSMFLNLRVTAQAATLSFIGLEYIVLDDHSENFTSGSDSIPLDNNFEYNFDEIPSGYSFLFHAKFSNACTSCNATSTSFKISARAFTKAPCTSTTTACNIVPNPSFENWNTTNYNCSTLNLANFSSQVCQWYSPSICANSNSVVLVGTPDYLNTCATNYSNNLLPNQQVSTHFLNGTNTGNGVAGIFLYAFNGGVNMNIPLAQKSYREYLQTTLLSSLVPGRVYQVSLWEKCMPGHGRYCKDLSVMFSSSIPCQIPNFREIDPTLYPGSQVIDMASAMMTNTLSFNQLAVTFQASAANDKMTIGSFKSNANANIQNIPGINTTSASPSYYNIDDIEIRTPTVALTPTVAISCPSNTLQLNPTVCELYFTNYTYQWQPATGVSNPNILNPVFNVNSPTVYTLTQIGVNTTTTTIITATVAFVFTNGLSLSASTPSPILCGNLGVNSTTLVASSNLATSYSWQPLPVTGNNIVVNPTVTTIYTVTSTYQNCTITNTVLVTVSNSCCATPSNMTTFNGQPITNSSSFGTPMVFNNDVIIQPGNSLTFNNTYFQFAPNVKIEVKNNAVLNIYGSHLYACAAMWKGIVVKDGGRVYAINEPLDNLIEDATTAIEVNCTPANNVSLILDLTNVTFNRNRLGININNYTGASTTYPFLIRNCVFTCRNLPFTNTSWPQTGSTNSSANSTAHLRYLTGTLASLSPPYLGQGFPQITLKSPYTTIYSESAIVLNNVGLSTSASLVRSAVIGDASSLSGFNLFDSHKNFIVSNNSNVKSINNVFQNTIYNPIQNGSAQLSSAIKAVNSYNNVDMLNTFLSTTSPVNPGTLINRFYNCHTGIEARNQATLEVKYSYFASTQSKFTTPSTNNPGYYGIYIYNNRFKSYLIQFSQFLNLNTGIYGGVTNDVITMTPGAVSINNPNPTYIINYGHMWGDCLISQNLFCAASATNAALGNGYMDWGVVFEKPISGISAPNAAFYNFLPNNGLRISYNNFYKVWNGVKVTSLASSNYIKTTGSNIIKLEPNLNPSAVPQRGIEYNANVYSAINSNTITGYGTTNTVTPMAGIYAIQNSNTSVRCNSVVTLPFGFHFASTNGATTWSVNTMFNNGIGLYGTNWGNGASGGIGPQGTTNQPSDNFWQGTWAANTNWQTFTGLNTNAGSSKIYARGSGNNGYYLNPNFNWGVFFNTSYWASPNRPTANSNTYGSCGNTNTSGGCTGCTARHWQEIAVDTIDWEDPKSEINRFLLYYTLELDSSLMSNDDTLTAFYEENSSSEMRTLMQIEEALAVHDMVTSSNLLGNFQSNSNIQDNYKTFYQLYYNFLHDSILSAQDSSNLLILASQCPFSDGPAVHKARAMYNSLYYTNLMFNDDGCIPEGYALRIIPSQGDSTQVPSKVANISALENHENVQSEKFPGFSFSIFPNPSNGVLNLRSFNKTQLMTCNVTDVLGKSVYSEKIKIISGEVSTLDLHLTSGVYYVNLTDEKNTKFVKKIVVH